MRLLKPTLGLAVIAAFLVCALGGTKKPVPDSSAKLKRDVEVVLVARTPKVAVGQDIVLWLVIHNHGQKPVRIDGRMAWPGNLHMGARWPGSGGDQPAETITVRRGLPTEAQMVNVQPECFHGREMIVGPHSRAPLISALKTLRRGQYTFYVAYTNDDPEGISELTDVDKLYLGKSNRVTVFVE